MIAFPQLINACIYREYRLGLNILLLTLDNGLQNSVVQKHHLWSLLNADNSQSDSIGLERASRNLHIRHVSQVMLTWAVLKPHFEKHCDYASKIPMIGLHTLLHLLGWESINMCTQASSCLSTKVKTVPQRQKEGDFKVQQIQARINTERKIKKTHTRNKFFEQNIP